MMRRVKTWLEAVEYQPTGLLAILIAVASWATLRNLVEIGWKKGDIYPMPSDALTGLKMLYLHFTLYWFNIYLLLCIVLFLLTNKAGNTLKAAMNVALLMLPIIVSPPIIDMALGNKEHIGYPDNPFEIFEKFSGFLDPHTLIYGITIGMRVEIFLVSIATGWYVYFKTKQVSSALLGAFGAFAIILGTGLWPSVSCMLYEKYITFSEYSKLSLSPFLQEGKILERSTHKISTIYLFVFSGLLLIVQFLRNPKTVNALLKNIRFTRSLHYILLYLGGLFIAQKIAAFEYGATIHPFDPVGVLAGVVAIFLAFQSAVLFNDIYDVKIDQVSNQRRPLVTGELSKNQALRYGRFLMLLSLLFSICLDESTFVLMAAFHALSFLYSCPPYRLRVYPIVPNVILGLVALVCFHIGSSLIAANDTFETVPEYISWAIIIGYSVATLMKDLKDYAGDKHEGVSTLMTILGESKGKLIIATLLCGLMFLLPFWFGFHAMHLFSGICAAILFGIVYWQKNEKYIFYVYFCYILTLFYHLYMSI